MATSSNFKATQFAEAVMQMNFWISQELLISTFLVLVGIFVFIFGVQNISFYISTPLWLRKYDIFDFPFDHTSEVSSDFLDGASSSWVSTLPSFGGHGPCECGDKTFLICHQIVWSMCHVSLLVGVPLSYVRNWLSLGSIGLVKVEI